MSDKRWTKWRRWALMFASQHSLAEAIDRTRFGRSPRCPVEDWSHPDETRDLIWIAAAAPEHISNSSTNISAMILTKGAPTMALRQPSIRTYSCGMASACRRSTGSADEGYRAILYRRLTNVASLKGG